MKYLKPFNENNTDLDNLKRNVDSILLDIKDEDIDITFESHITDYMNLMITFSATNNHEFVFTDTLYDCLKTIESLFDSSGYKFIYDYECFDPIEDDNYINSGYRIDNIKSVEPLDLQFMFLHLRTYEKKKNI